jgi:hypothetical protein
MALSAYPDVEKAVLLHLPALLVPLPAGIIGIVARDTNVGASDTIAAGKAHMVAYRIAGGDDGITDYPLLSIEFFASTRAIAYALAEKARQIVTATPLKLGTVIIDNTSSSVGPRRLPWENQEIRRLGIECRVSVRR